MSKQFSFFIHPDDEPELLNFTAEKTEAVLIPEFYKSTREKIKPVSLPLSSKFRQTHQLYLTHPQNIKDLEIFDRKSFSSPFWSQNPALARYFISCNDIVIEYSRSLSENNTLKKGRLYAQTRYIRHKDDSTWEKRMETAYFAYPTPEYLRWVTKVFSLWKRNLELHERVYFSKRAWELFRKGGKKYVPGSGMEKILIS